jgi:ParB-like chromosome segregation protein Spo0J
MKVVDLPLSHISRNQRAQPRAKLDEQVIAEYAEAMRQGEIFPPVTVFYDGKDYWLADGYLRFEAAARIGRDSISAEVHEGTLRDATLWAVGANATHGRRRSEADKQRAARQLLSLASLSWPSDERPVPKREQRR